MTPYFFKQMRKRTGLCLVVVLTALAFSLALCMLQRSRDQMAVRIEEVYDNLEVRCSVTNLTGTQSDRLNLPEWVLRLFTTGMTTGNFQEDGLFTPYVRDVQVRSTVYCTQPGGTVPHALSGITGLAADSALQQIDGAAKAVRQELPGALAAFRDAMTNMAQAAEQLRRATGSAESVLGRDSPTMNDLRRLLKEAIAAARSLRDLTDMLERNPEALLKGKKGKR